MDILNKRYSIIQKITEKNPLYQRPDYGWVLMFHEVSNDIANFQKDITISSMSFWNLIDALGKFALFSPIDLVLKSKGENQIFLTFDDVCETAYNNAMFMLESKSIPFCCFVSPGLVGKKRYIKNEQLLKLKEFSCCQIQAHGMEHIMLRHKTEREITYEIAESQKYVSDFMGNQIEERMFAYPYGSKYAVPQKAFQVCERIGIDKAFGTYNLPLNKRYVSNLKYFLPRINVNEENHVEVLDRIKKYCG